MKIDPRSHIPIYQQIADAVRARVASGALRAGEAVPSVRALALEALVNPNTVQRAYEELEREGLIEAQRGRGMFVSPRAARSARSQSEEGVQSLLRQAVQAAGAAGLARERVQELFEAVLWEAAGKSTARR